MGDVRVTGVIVVMRDIRVIGVVRDIRVIGVMRDISDEPSERGTRGQWPPGHLVSACVVLCESVSE